MFFKQRVLLFFVCVNVAQYFLRSLPGLVGLKRGACGGKVSWFCGWRYPLCWSSNLWEFAVPVCFSPGPGESRGIGAICLPIASCLVWLGWWPRCVLCHLSWIVFLPARVPTALRTDPAVPRVSPTAGPSISPSGLMLLRRALGKHGRALEHD